MTRISLLLIVAVAIAATLASTAPAAGRPDGQADPVFGIRIYPGYRDWRLVSVAHEEGNLFTYLARTMKVAKKIHEATGLEQMADIEKRIRSYLAVVESRLLDLL